MVIFVIWFSVPSCKSTKIKKMKNNNNKKCNKSRRQLESGDDIFARCVIVLSQFVLYLSWNCSKFQMSLPREIW